MVELAPLKGGPHAETWWAMAIQAEVFIEMLMRENVRWRSLFK